MKRPVVEPVSQRKQRPVLEPDVPNVALARRAVLSKEQWPKMARPGVPGKAITYYVGDEVCFSPMFGHATLFVVGLQSAKEIIGHARTNKSYDKTINHIYLGANDSFDHNTPKWVRLIEELLKAKYYVSLEVDYTLAHTFEAEVILENSYFCLTIKLKMPNAGLFRNAALRIEDEKFLGDNGGVWTHSMASLTTPSGNDFSPWRWFSKDKVIK